ncbi:T9SS type A sorting domain-containing protein [Bacteroidota bacterium]
MKFQSLSFLVLTCITLSVQGQIINIPNDQQTIQAGINTASDGDTVLVDRGTYKENIRFNGKAITVASRYILDKDTSHISRTIIDGSQPSNQDSASVIIFDDNETSASVLCGFTIQGGAGSLYTTSVSSYFLRSGGGIFIGDFCGATIDHNIIRDNHISSTYRTQGGGVVVMGGGTKKEKTVIIQDNIICNNSASTTSESGPLGGGLAIAVGADSEHITLLVQNNLITNNEIRNTHVVGIAKGGGLSFYLSIPSPPGEYIIRNNEISYNSVYGNGFLVRGGGIMHVQLLWTGTDFYDSIPVPEIYNNVIVGNYAQSFGGGVVVSRTIYEEPQNYWISPRPLLTNNTIINNSSPGDGDGIITGSNVRPVLLNNIFWNDSSSNEISIWSNEVYFIYNNCVRGMLLSPQSNNIRSNPFFANDSYELSDSSECIGKGIDSIKLENTWYRIHPIDMKGNPRPSPIDSNVDIGALESSSSPTDIENKSIEKNPLLIFPNPFNSVLSLKLTTNALINHIEIISLDGKIARSIDNLNSRTVTIYRNNLPSGLYILKIQSDRTYIEKLIIE